MKIKKRYSEIISTVWISVAMSLSISFFMTMINKVPGDKFITSWLTSSLIGSMIGVPLASMYVPSILKVIEKMEEDEED